MSDKALLCPHCQTPIVGGKAGQASCPACGAPLEVGASPPSGAFTGRRRLTWLILSSITLVGLAVVWIIVSFWDQPRAQQAGPAPAPGPSALPDSSQPGGPVASLLSIAGGTSPAVVALGTARYHDSTPNNADESIMAHEIVRQAVLFAARDMGAIVRDESIGDSIPGGAPTTGLEVGSSFAMGRVPVAVLARRSTGGREVLATFELGGPMPRFIDYPTLVERAEALSRSEDGFRKVLQASGLKPTAPVPLQGDRPAEEIEKRLARMTFTEPFAALRLLHGEIRDRGESPGRLGALARGYANLGALTDFHWSGGAKAFKARALLVAQRMVARGPKSPGPLWHRAYARALIGYHKDALGDLDSAAKLAGPGAANDGVPTWVALVDPLCRFQTGKLAAARSGPDKQLALFLAYLTAEWPTAGSTRTINLGRDLLQTNPECYRVYDSLSRFIGVSNGQWSTSAGLTAFTEAIPGRLGELPGLAMSVASKLRDGATETEVERALIAAGRDDGDRGEPSWGSLGRMVMDARFALLIRRAQFMKATWNVPTDDFVAETRSLVADHPYLPLLDSYAVDQRINPAGFARLIQQVEIPDIDFVEERYAATVSLSDYERHKKLVTKMICHGDTFYQDLAMVSRWTNKEGMPEVARSIERTSPSAPMARALLIDNDWAYAEPRAKEWEAEAITNDRPEILYNLGSRYVDLKRWDDAERCLSKSIEMESDLQTLKLMAKVYQGRGDLERWKATLERALEAEDAGLDHMVIRVDLANYYIGLKQFDKALPYAEAAAATWAGKGMYCAAICHEWMGHWDQAELWIKRATERYPQSDWMAWYIWCQRTGHGDLAAARASAMASMASFGDQPAVGLRDWIGIFHMIDGSPKEALAILLPLQDKSPTPIRGLTIASQAEALGDSATRDRVLASLDALPQTQQLKLASSLKLLRATLAGEKFDPEAMLAALREIPEQSRYTIALFVGLLLHGHGAADFAKDTLYRSFEKSQNSGWVQATISVAIRAWEKTDPKPAPPK
jgi:tetratricopeptide (TPR) repeat protein